MQKIILTYGTYDLFHIGHLKLLKRLKQLGSKLIVAVSTDEFNALKGKKTIIPFQQRTEIISELKCVDLVISEESWNQKTDDIKKYNVDIMAMGDDWEGKFDFLKEQCEVVYLPRTKNISTTEIKNSLKSIISIPKDELVKAFEVLEQLKQEFE